MSKGVTPVLSSEEATALLEGMDVSSVVGLRHAVAKVSTSGQGGSGQAAQAN